MTGRRSASDATASENLLRILKERGDYPPPGKDIDEAAGASFRLRRELRQKGLKGFKKGGPVKKTQKAVVHKGEYVVKPSGVKKIGASTLRRANRLKGRKTTKRKRKT